MLLLLLCWAARRAAMLLLLLPLVAVAVAATASATTTSTLMIIITNIYRYLYSCSFFSKMWLDTLGFLVSSTAGPGICSRLLQVGGAALHYYWGDAGAPLLG